MTKQPDGKPEASAESEEVGLVPLSKRARATTTALGVVFSGGGGAATFLTENQVGTGALLILGALFLIAAITGRFPSRLQIGDNVVEFPTTKQTLDKVAEIAPPDVAVEVIESVVEYAPRSVQRYASRLLSHIELEANVLEGARKAAEVLNRPGSGATYVADPSEVSSGRGDGGYDVAVHGGKQPVYIDCLTTRSQDIAKRLRERRARLEVLPGLGMLVVHSNISPQAIRKIVQSWPTKIPVLVTNDLEDPEALQDRVAAEIVRLLEQ